MYSGSQIVYYDTSSVCKRNTSIGTNFSEGIHTNGIGSTCVEISELIPLGEVNCKHAFFFFQIKP